MSTEWNQARLQKLIDDQVEESHNLEYKAAGALTIAKKDEISKDISAMANSSGGVIIYGIAEFRDESKKHLPEKFSPVLRTEFSKERLEQLINSNIKPRIEQVVIRPVSLDSGGEHVAYIVEIPQSTTAHQAGDFRYYRRYNFEVLPMLDHEMRDVMNRQQHPLLQLQFEFILETWRSPYPLPPIADKSEDVLSLQVFAQNDGRVYAKYVNCFLAMPAELLGQSEAEARKKLFNHDGIEYYQWSLENTMRDVVGNSGGFPTYGPSRYDPILPGLRFAFKSFRITPVEGVLKSETLDIKWIAHADNAPQVSGTIKIKDIPVIDKRS